MLVFIRNNVFLCKLNFKNKKRYKMKNLLDIVLIVAVADMINLWIDEAMVYSVET